MKKKSYESEKFDAIIIGSGQAGNPLAKDLASNGWKVAVIERNYVGGSCINYGCTPSKTMAASAQMADSVKKIFRIRDSFFFIKSEYERDLPKKETNS